MKIQSINAFTAWNSNSNYRKAKNFSQPNFCGTLNVSQLKKMPLEKKLTYLFSTIGNGDIVAVGKNFEVVHKGITKAIDGFNDIIKRILFVKHPELTVPIAFGFDSDENLSCVNIGNNNILVSMNDDTECLEPKDACNIEEGDIIINNDINIPIGIFADYSENENDADDMELLMNPKNFVTKTIDLEEFQQSKIVNANKLALDTLKTKSKEAEKQAKAKKLSFKDVGGMDKTLETLKRSVLYPIKYPFAYKNVDVNKGIILYGKPGTGKTLVAEALAGECDAHFIKLCGTDLESKWVGETEASWRKTFADARENQPSIIFIDEFDAIVKERGKSESGQSSDKVVNQILSLMSDLEKSSDNVFVIATTNKIDTIDPAVKRSGRFGKHIEISVPDRKGLRAIFGIHTKNRTVAPDFDLERYLDEFKNRQFTGADIKHVVNEAHTNSWIRQGIYEKMEAGTLTPKDMKEANISEEDFAQALADWDKNKPARKRNPIGFNK